MTDECDWCGEEKEIKFKASITDVDGVVLETVNICKECAVSDKSYSLGGQVCVIFNVGTRTFE